MGILAQNFRFLDQGVILLVSSGLMLSTARAVTRVQPGFRDPAPFVLVYLLNEKKKSRGN